QRALEVDGGAGRQRAEGRAPERLADRGDGEGVPLVAGHGEADPVDGDGVADGQLARIEAARADRQRAPALPRLDPEDGAGVLDQAGEHAGSCTTDPGGSLRRGAARLNP